MHLPGDNVSDGQTYSVVVERPYVLAEGYDEDDVKELVIDEIENADTTPPSPEYPKGGEAYDCQEDLDLRHGTCRRMQAGNGGRRQHFLVGMTPSTPIKSC